jgi:NDP-sugar pyrophosphorylase family protein
MSVSSDSPRRVTKAVILAAGKGTRMGELTKAIPKPMLEVKGKPVLQRIIEGLRDEAKITEIFIVTGWCGEVIREHFGDGASFGIKAAYGEQVVQDGTGKAPEFAKAWVGAEPFLFTYGDILLDDASGYAQLVGAFRESGVIALKDGQDLTKGGAVVLDQDGFMIDLVEKGSGAPPANAFYNAGIYLMPAAIFDFTSKLEKSPRGEYEFTDALKAFVKSGAKLRGAILGGGWNDVRDPGVLGELNG